MESELIIQMNFDLSYINPLIFLNKFAKDV